MNKTAIWAIVAVIVVAGGLYFFMGNMPGGNKTSSTTPTENQNSLEGNGRVLFSVRDAAADMSTISEINMAVSRVDMHSNVDGWVTVSSTPRAYNLLALNAENKNQILADVNVAAGSYDQVRLVVDSISVKTKAGTTKSAKLPSGELKINTNVLVEADSTSSVNFDFLADKSLHTTGKGEYIFAPVVKTESKSSAEVSVDTSGTVIIIGGHTDGVNTLGMDLDGSMKLNFQLSANQKLSIDTNNVIKLEGTILGN